MSQKDMRQVSVRGGRQPVWIQAGEPPALVLPHYWGGSRAAWFPRLFLVCPAGYW
jgi:hypothetical protein